MSGGFIPERDPITGKILSQSSPFAAKVIPDGKLFRRVHGVTATLAASGDTVVEFNIPYVKCKITEMQLAWCPEGVTVDLEVYDTPTGTISTVPNYKLNQFGFGVAVASGFYSDESSYDADLIQNMKVKVVLHNASETTKTIGVNFVLHEIVA